MKTPLSGSSTSGPMAQAPSGAGRKWVLSAYLAPPALLVMLLVIYFISPSFYLRYVLELQEREAQAVEVLTFAAALLAAGLLALAGRRQWRAIRATPGASRLPGGPLLLLLAALASFFFAGEEINWGQTYLGWEASPTFVDKTGSKATNLHNIDLPVSVQGLGSLYVFIMFVGLPLLWTQRRRLALPRDWACAVAQGPVVSCMILAMAWKSGKRVYHLFTSETQRLESSFYAQFVEQINEQREMLIAVGLLIFALQIWHDARRGVLPSPVGRTNQPDQ